MTEELSKNEITVYTTKNCYNCIMIKNKLKENNISFDEVILDSTNVSEIVDISGIMSAPIVLMKDTYFTGVEALKELGCI